MAFPKIDPSNTGNRVTGRAIRVTVLPLLPEFIERTLWRLPVGFVLGCCRAVASRVTGEVTGFGRDGARRVTSQGRGPIRFRVPSGPSKTNGTFCGAVRD